jgi:hypothetical protein
VGTADAGSRLRVREHRRRRRRRRAVATTNRQAPANNDQAQRSPATGGRFSPVATHLETKYLREKRKNFHQSYDCLAHSRVDQHILY